MPSLVTYERKRLTEAQYHALGVYITRKRLREEANQNGTASSETDKQTSPSCDDVVEEVISKSPAKPSAREVREQKQQELNDVLAQLADLESTLNNLKEKKHEFFEELKGLVHSKKHEEKEKQMQGFPSPFIQHPGISPGAAMMNIFPFRPGSAQSVIVQ
jgi:flagellar motility protein MotE (MotC chaperone)